MRVPLEWLKDYVAIRLKPEALAHRLTMAGLEVTGIATVDGQPVFDIEVTPNRADCLSIIGIAREVAAMTGQRLKLPKFGVRNSEFGMQRKHSQLRIPHSAFRIRIVDRKGCRRYIGRLLTGVTVGPSPSWMQRRLSACGIRPINNVVDITNYVLLEYGQPLHAFDVERLAQRTILVRRATEKEAITTLDGVARTLSPDMLVIADASRAVAVAGVMGGVGSEVTPRTAAVLLESAWFDPVTVRRTSRALGLASESSYRFERGVDQVGVETASARAASLICQLAGGTEQACLDAGEKPAVKPAIVVDASRAGRWLGVRSLLRPAQMVP
jgi:phenylalanyl-tRNA synthetase beta chain